MIPTSQTLKSISHEILTKLPLLPEQDRVLLFNMEDYHGFGKTRLSDDFLNNILKPYQLVSSEVQIEIVRVTTDLTHEVHFHKNSFAYVIILGHENGIADPIAAMSYKDGVWSPVISQQEIEIPPGTVHGFTVDTHKNGILYFLSVQAPPIVDETGRDDYHHP